MKARWQSPWLSLCLPEGILLLAALAFLRPGVLPAWTVPLVQAYAYLVFGAGLLVGWYVGWGRILLVGLVLVLADQSLLFAKASAQAAELEPILFKLVALLLPLNLLGLSLIGEQRRNLLWRILPLVLVLLQLVAGVWLCQPGNRHWASVLDVRLLDPSWTAWSALPQAALVAFVAGVLLLLARFLISRNQIDKGTVWTLGAGFVALQGAASGWSATEYFATAGLILILSVYAESRRRLYVDALTGLASRAAFDQALFHLPETYTLAIVEIDRLKQINVDYGYPVRNQVLRLVGGTLKRLPASVRSFRFNDSSFAVIITESTAVQVRPVLERIRRAVEATAVPLPSRLQPLAKPDPEAKAPSAGQSLTVTISIGVAERDDPKMTAADVLRAAQKNLFVSKWAGGNRLKDQSA